MAAEELSANLKVVMIVWANGPAWLRLAVVGRSSSQYMVQGWAQVPSNFLDAVGENTILGL